MFPAFAVTADTARPPAPAACPMCGGPLFEVRGLNRCARCHYAICQNCDGEQAEPVEPDAREW
jgi:uncharacterized Zn finger protein (UPF0148 family)